MVLSQLRSDLGLLYRLVVFDWRQFEVLNLAVGGGSYHESIQVWDGSLSLLLRGIDKPGEPLKAVHLERSTEDDLLESFSHRRHSFFELHSGNKSRDLLQIECAAVWIILVQLRPVQTRQVLSPRQVEQVHGH